MSLTCLAMHRYDAGGFNNLQQSDFDFEVDLSQLGMVNTAMAAVFSKLGAPTLLDS